MIQTGNIGHWVVKCKYCGELGHNIKTCPKRKEAEKKSQQQP